ncbi:MAG: hypothetical protein JWO87_1175, partial [Phycisphaerales bacterium]|nr:hypothetical protein [Phycisphaerales bacterium]
LKATGDGTVVLAGGFTYASNTDYVGGQYKDFPDVEWKYDAAADAWSGPNGATVPDSRTYRTGPFNPEFFLNGPPPDAAAFKAVLDALPANTWVKTNPPRLPRMNRDWGSAVLDPDRGLILRWSGGHSAHGGTDVLHYHIATNRWELCYPVEFPLGQLYSNTSYPDGYNFNLRPWITGHTYQNYGIDPVLKKMLFTGRERQVYFYDPDLGDWTGRGDKPKEMCYSGCFYTLTTTPTPGGLIAWTVAGKLFRFTAVDAAWHEIKPSRGSLPGACVDNSTVVYDTRRDRLLFAKKQYGDNTPYDGELYSLDLRTLEAAPLSPQGKAAASDIPYLCQLRYDSDHDLLFAGATLPPGADGVRRTPAYDCAANRWVSLKITGDDPSGPKGRNVSLGLMYDAKRKLFWAVDADCKVYVLRLDPATADLQAL